MINWIGYFTKPSCTLNLATRRNFGLYYLAEERAYGLFTSFRKDLVEEVYHILLIKNWDDNALDC